MWIAVGGAAVMSIVVAAVITSDRGAPGSPAAAAPGDDARIEVAVPASDAAAPKAPAASKATIDAAVPEAHAVTGDAAEPLPAARPRNRPKRPKRSRTAVSCDPPYTVDGTGKRFYKPECLK